MCDILVLQGLALYSLTNLEQKPNNNDHAMLKHKSVRQAQTTDTFFTAYPENWEHYIY